MNKMKHLCKRVLSLILVVSISFSVCLSPIQAVMPENEPILSEETGYSEEASAAAEDIAFESSEDEELATDSIESPSTEQVAAIPDESDDDSPQLPNEDDGNAADEEENLSAQLEENEDNDIAPLTAGDESGTGLPDAVKNSVTSGMYGSGSYMLNPDNEKYRFYTEYFANGNKTLAGSQRINQFFVYLKEGEYVLFGSSVYNSILDIDDKQHGSFGSVPTDDCVDIVVTDTDGIKHGFDVVENGVGYIANRDNEVKGPKIAASDYTGTTGSGKYEPLVYQADKAGVYTFAFHSVYGNNDGSSNVNPSPVKCKDPWNQTKLTVAAWDITVAGQNANNTGYEVKTGRVWSNYLSLNAGAAADCVTSLNLFVLTKDGIEYKVDFTDIVPFGFQFFANNLGFTLNDGKTPLYHSFYDNDNRIDNPESEEYVTFHKPSASDTATQVTHTIFFEQPSTEARRVIVHGTDLSGSQTPVIGNYHIRGYTDNRIRYGTGADFSFDVAYASSVTLRLDFCGVINTKKTSEHDATEEEKHTLYQELDKNGHWQWKAGTAHYYLEQGGTGYAEVSGPVVSGTYDSSTQTFTNGHNVLHWDGKDSAGYYLPLGVYDQQHDNGETKVQITSLLKKGEIHFPFMDVEGLRGGVTIENLNDSTNKRFDLYYNNFPLTKGTIEGTSGTLRSNYYTLSDGTRSYNGAVIKKGKGAASQEFFTYGTRSISTLITQQFDGFGDRYVHEPVDSSENSIRFGNYGDAGGGDQAGIDIWTYYYSSQNTYTGTYLNFEITAEENVANITGRVFYDNDLDGVWTKKPVSHPAEGDDTAYNSQDTGNNDIALKGIIVRLLDNNGNPIKVEKMQNVIDKEGNFLYDENGVPVKERVVVDFEAETDENGEYIFENVPFDAQKGTTYHVQVMLSKLETEYKMYVCTSTNATVGSMVGEEKNGVRTYLTDNRSVQESIDEETKKAVETAGSPRAVNGQDGNTVQLKSPTGTQTTESGRREMKILSYQRYDANGDLKEDGTPVANGEKGVKKWDGSGEVVYNSANAQSIRLTSDYKNKTIRFNDIGYISTINPGDMATMVVRKEWANNNSSGLTELNLQLWEWNPTVSAVEEEGALGERTRGGHLIDTVVIKESNDPSWEHRWHNLDKSKAYYVIETYNKVDSMGVPETFDNGKPREVMIGSTFPMFAGPDYVKAYFKKYQNETYYARGHAYKGRLYRAAKLKSNAEKPYTKEDYEQDENGKYYYVFPGRGDGPCNDVWVYDSDANDAVPRKLSGLHEICTFDANPQLTDHYQAEVLWETMTDANTNSRQFNVTFDLKTEGNERVLVFHNEQTFNEQAYYIWQGHDRELPYFISKMSQGAYDAVSKTYAINHDNENMEPSSQTNSNGGKLIKGVVITNADNAVYDAAKGEWSGVTGGDATADFTYVADPVECVDKPDKYGKYYTEYRDNHDENGDRSIAMFNASAKVTVGDKEEYKYKTGTHTFVVDYVVQVTKDSNNVTTETPVEVKAVNNDIKVETSTGAWESVYAAGSTAVKPIYREGYKAYRWNMTIYIYDVDDDQVYEYDPGLLNSDGEHEPLRIVEGLSAGSRFSWYYNDEGEYVNRDPRTEAQLGLLANDHYRIGANPNAVSTKVNASTNLIGVAYSPYGILKDKTVYENSAESHVDGDAAKAYINEKNAIYLTYWDTNEYDSTQYTPLNPHALPNPTDVENEKYRENGLSTYLDADEVIRLTTLKNGHLKTDSGTNADTSKTLRGVGGNGDTYVHAKGGDIHVTMNYHRSSPFMDEQDQVIFANVDFIPNGTSLDDLSTTDVDESEEHFYYRLQVFGEEARNDYTPYYTQDATKGVALLAHFSVKQAPKTNASIKGATLSIGDQIDVNFYAGDVLDGMRDHYFMEFSDANGSSLYQTGSVTLPNTQEKTEDNTRYVRARVNMLSDEPDTPVPQDTTDTGWQNTTRGTIYLQPFIDGVNLTLEAGTNGTEAGANGNKSGKKLYGFTFTKLNAYEMGKDITATLYYSEDGLTFVQCGNPVTYSIAQYAYNILRSDQYKSTKLYNMLLDMLNYGAAAQDYAVFVDADTGKKKWIDDPGTPVNKKLGNYQDRADETAARGESFKALSGYHETVSGAGIKNLGVSVILEEGMSTALKIRFEVPNAVKNCRLKIHSDTTNLDDLTYNGLDGGSTSVKKDNQGNIILEGTQFTDDGNHRYSVTISGVPPFYWCYDYELTFVNADGNEVKYDNTNPYKLTYSVFDYCNAKQGAGVLGKLVKAMYNYGMTANLWRQDENEGSEEVYKNR